MTKRGPVKARKGSETKPAPVPAAEPKPRIRRIPARTLTGRSEDQDPGARGHALMQQAGYTEGRPAYDRYDGMAKVREAQQFRAEGQALLRPTADNRVLKACGEAIAQDARDAGLSLEQRAVEWAIIDTLENPSMVNIGASQLRMEPLQRLGILQPAMDAAQAIGADDPIEKMLSHQQTALHFAGLRAMERSVGAGDLREPDPVHAARWLSMATKCFAESREHTLAILKLKTKGKQTVVVQHVNVSNGGQAVVAGQLTKSGGGSGSNVEGGEGQK